MSTSKRPVQDSGLPKPVVPYHAGSKKQVTSKAELADTGTVGYATADAPHVHTTAGPTGRHPDDDELEYAPQRRLMPKDIPVSSTPGHTGAIVRFLDGHSEIHRERPGLVEMLNDPGMAQHHGDIKNEIAMRDSVHNHRYW
jgi:hypothetical protein